MRTRAALPRPGLAYADTRGRIFYDAALRPLRRRRRRARTAPGAKLIPAPPGTVPRAMLPGRVFRASVRGKVTLGATRGAPVRCCPPATRVCSYCRPIACGTGRADVARSSVTRTRASSMTNCTWRRCRPTRATTGRRDGSRRTNSRLLVERRRARDPSNGVLAQLSICATAYGCFTAQNVFLERGEAALPVSPKCNARCNRLYLGARCRTAGHSLAASFACVKKRRRTNSRVSRSRIFAVVPDGIVSFGQGCEGEPLLARDDARARPSRRYAPSSNLPERSISIRTGVYRNRCAC